MNEVARNLAVQLEARMLGRTQMPITAFELRALLAERRELLARQVPERAIGKKHALRLVRMVEKLDASEERMQRYAGDRHKGSVRAAEAADAVALHAALAALGVAVAPKADETKEDRGSHA